MQPFSVEDIACQRRIGALHAQCGHDLVVFAVESVDLDADRCCSALWCVRLAGGEPHALTHRRGRDEAPRVSHDGRRIAFLSDREGAAPQVHMMETGGGEARSLGHFALGARSIEWSPDGRQLLVRAAVGVDPEARGARAAPGSAAPARPAGAPQLLWRLPHASGSEDYTLDREIHLFALDLARGQSRRLTDGPFDVGGACWSPGGERIAYTRSCSEPRQHLRSDLWIAAADGSAARRVAEDVAADVPPAWSPDGRWIAFAAAAAPAEGAGDRRRRLWLHDLEDGGVQPLGSDELELAGDAPLHWQEDGAAVIALLVARGLQQVCAVTVPDGQRRVLVDGDRHVVALALARGYLVYGAEGAATPRELFASDLEGRYEVPLTALNTWWHERAAPQAERRRFAVPDGAGGIETADAWVLRPPGSERVATPWLIDVADAAGGWTPLDYESHPYWPVLVSRGWSVLALDAVGSGGYGREFARRLDGRRGELDLAQHLAAFEQLQREGLADRRVAMVGTACGGARAAEALGHGTPWRAVVLRAPELGHGAALPALLAAPALAQCPPTLILQGRADRRCPAAHAEALFAALSVQATAPCEMVCYPDGRHDVLAAGRPAERLDAARRLVDWLERWIGPPPAAPLTERIHEPAHAPTPERLPEPVPAEAVVAATRPRRRRPRTRGEAEAAI